MTDSPAAATAPLIAQSSGLAVAALGLTRKSFPKQAYWIWVAIGIVMALAGLGVLPTAVT